MTHTNSKAVSDSAPKPEKFLCLLLLCILVTPVFSTVADNTVPAPYRDYSDRWISPLVGYFVVSPFSTANSHGETKHRGIDVVATRSTRLLAPAPGVVIVSAGQDNYFQPHENLIVIDHGDNLVSLFAGLKNRTVTVGQWVQAGQTIGRVKGRLDNNPETFTHIEIIDRGRPIDPFIKLPYRFFNLELPPHDH